MTAMLVAALLVLAGAYWRAMRAADVRRTPALPGRHRLSPKHPGFEDAPEVLKELLRAQRAERSRGSGGGRVRH